MQRRTNQEKIHILKTYWKSENSTDVITTWPQFFNSDPPHRNTIYALRDKFNATGSVLDAPRSGRPISVSTQENIDSVGQFFVEQPQTSAVSASRQLDIPRTSLRRLIRTAGLKCYHPRLVHGLIEDDGDRRLQFCELFKNQLNETPELLDHIIWTDESTFKLSGHINRHNCVYYDTTNPHATFAKQLNQPGVSVWGGLSTRGVIGPIFLDGTLTGAKYHTVLQEEIVPLLEQRGDFNSLWFQQDGAPPHYATVVRNYLNETFPGRWLGRRGSVDWPARSPDLTPMDYFFWGMAKDYVYKERLPDIDSMKRKITDFFNYINNSPELCETVCRSVAHRLEQCIDADGMQFEHFS